jgi:hypothetical protein
LLGWYKYFIARALNSALVYADALSSLCAGLASLVALVVAEDRAMAWWADAMAGSLVACYTLYQGYLTVIKSIVSPPASLIVCRRCSPSRCIAGGAEAHSDRRAHGPRQIRSKPRAKRLVSDSDAGGDAHRIVGQLPVARAAEGNGAAHSAHRFLAECVLVHVLRLGAGAARPAADAVLQQSGVRARRPAVSDLRLSLRVAPPCSLPVLRVVALDWI